MFQMQSNKNKHDYLLTKKNKKQKPYLYAPAASNGALSVAHVRPSFHPSVRPAFGFLRIT